MARHGWASLAVAAAVAVSATVEGKNVLRLDDNTFEAARNVHPLLFVKFFAPW